MGTLFQELKRRNIFKVGAAYLVLSWLILQVASVLAPILHLPSVVLSGVVFFLVLGLPLALLLAWAFELTPDGIKRTAEVDASTSVTDKTGHKLNILTSVLLVAVLVFLGVDRFYLSKVDAPSGDAVPLDIALGDRTYESIAVLPFVNMSDDQEQEYFSDGISEELLNLLAKTKGLRVAARTSSFAYKGHNQNIRKIGEDLDVQTVLEGSVRKAQTKLRITAQLIDVDTGYHLWSETYDRELEDIFAIQDEISAAIVSALQVHFGGEVSSAPKQSYQPSLAAYEAYLKGQEFIKKRTKVDIENALELFTEAIELDPKFALAYTGKANAYMLLSDRGGAYGDIPVKYAVEFATPLVDIALELEPDLAEAENSRGFILHSEGKREEALKAYDRAIELSPSFAIAHMWRSQLIDDTEGIVTGTPYLEAAYKLDPMSALLIQNLANRYINLRRFDDATYLLRKLEEIAPDRTSRIALVRARLEFGQGNWASGYNVLRSNFEDISVLRGNLAGASYSLHNMEEYYKYSNDFGHFWHCYRMEDFDCIDDLWKKGDMFDQNSEFGHYIRFMIALAKQDYTTAKEQILQTGFDPDDFEKSFRGQLENLGTPEVALLYRKLGDEDMAQKLIAFGDKRIAETRAQGYDFLVFQIEAQNEVLKGNPEKAVALLRKSYETNGLGWYDRLQLLIIDLAGRPDFEALFAELVDDINAARVELGWEPLSYEDFYPVSENG